MLTKSSTYYFCILFRFGSRNTSVIELIGEKLVIKIVEKFSENSAKELSLALRELCRYLYLCAYNCEGVFFPGNQLVDDIWHNLITETSDYRMLCGRLRKDIFIDHTGTTFSDYVKKLSDQTVLNEQLSWVTSYIHNFGDFEPEVKDLLPLLTAIMGRMNISLSQLNKLGQSLGSISKVCEVSNMIEINEIVNEISKIVEEVDADINIAKQYVQILARYISEKYDLATELPPNTFLENLFGASAALAFLFWQHLACIERLQSLPDWKCKNENLWASIVAGKVTCGLATTHLAGARGAGIRGSKASNGYIVNGIAPWVCGFQIFDYLLVGFETQDEVVFSLTPFPTHNVSNVKIENFDMACMSGTSTVKVKFDNYFLKNSEVVSIRGKSDIVLPRKTIFIIPELGIGKVALGRLKNIIGGSDNPRHFLFEASVLELERRLVSIELKRKDVGNLDQLVFLRDEFNRDTVRLLTMAVGATSILKGSSPMRLQMSLFFLDIIIHSAASIQMKVKRSGTGYSI